MFTPHRTYRARRFGAELNSSRAFAASRSDGAYDVVTLFIFAVAFCLSVMITIIGMVSRQWNAPLVAHNSGTAFNFNVTVDGPKSKEQFLARVTAAEKREMAATVHYVGDIIARKASRLSRTDAHRLAQQIVLESKRQNFDPIFVAAVIKSESTFNKLAVSSVGALGLMQILPDTGRYISHKNDIDWLGAPKLKDPSYNIRLGIAYLKYLEQYFGQNREHILVAYNWGPGNLLSALKKRSNLPSGPKNYARTILRDHSKWQREYVERAEEFQFLVADSLLG